MRKLAVISVGRSDFGILTPILEEIQSRRDIELQLIVSGMHLNPEAGCTVKEIEQAGYPIAARIDMALASDQPAALAKMMGLGTIGFAQAYDSLHPDIIVLLGDRFEMHAAAVAALPFPIALAHIHGGEISEGAIDDSMRHSLTKLSHFHFASTERSAARILRMGEESWRVTVSGAPSLDNILKIPALSAEDFRRKFDLPFGKDFALVTFHSTTREVDAARHQVEEVLAALESGGHPILFTLANSDPGGLIINQAIRQFVKKTPSAFLVENLGRVGYFSAMRLAMVMVGNSSSGIIEAASFDLPVVNIGNRQKGRERSANVLDCNCDRVSIRKAIEQAVSCEFRSAFQGLKNPYGNGSAARNIVDRLATIPLGANVLTKKFSDE